MDGLRGGALYSVLFQLENFVLFCAAFVLFYHTLDRDTQAEMLALVTGQKKKQRRGRFPDVPDGMDTDGTTVIIGHEVANPFPSLENLEDKATQEWLESQHQATAEYINQKIAGTKEAFSEEYRHATLVEMPDNPVNYGGTYFFFKKVRTELPQYTLFATTHLSSEAKVTLDPNTLCDPLLEQPSAGSEEGGAILANMVVVHGVWISTDGFKIAYGYTKSSNSNEMNVAVRDVNTRADTVLDTIRGCFVDYTSIAWVDSRSGFFYSTQVLVPDERDPDSVTYSNRVCFHKLGTSQEHDLLVFETPSETDNMMINTHITSDGHYLLLEIFKRRREIGGMTLWRATIADHCATSPIGNKVFYYDLSKFDGHYAESLGCCVKLIDTFQFRFDYVSSVEDDFWFRSNFQAVNFRVVRVTLPDLNSHEDDPETEAWRVKLLQSWKNCLDWIPQRTDGDYLESASIAAHTVLVLKYLKDSAHEVLLFDLTQDLVQESQIPVASLPHPPFGTIIGPNCNFYSSEIFYQCTSYADPSSVYRALVDRDHFTGAISISFHEVNSTAIPRSDKYLFDTEQVYVETMRNVSVPLLMFGLRDTLDDLRQEEAAPPKPRPCILFVCGGFGMSTTPVFSPALQLFAKHCQGLVLVSNVQGSGIYGAAWSKNGCKENKENPVADLRSLIKHVIGKGYTTADQLALYGGTFNGTLLGAAAARFPELFSAAVVEDGVFDLLRYPVYNPTFLDSQQVADERFARESTWYQEFGNAEDSEEELKRLLALSPLHNISGGVSRTTYPAVLLMAALPPDGKMFNNSVSPVHSMKLMAQMQRLWGNLEHCKERPLLLYLTQDSLDDSITSKLVERSYAGSTIEEVSTAFAFIIENIGATWVPGPGADPDA